MPVKNISAILSLIHDVVWVDPGGVHGFAHYSIRHGMQEMQEYTTFDLAKNLQPMLWDPTRYVVGVERFVLNVNTIKKKDAAHAAIEGMGVVRYLATIERDVAIFDDSQTSSVVKKFCPDAVLKRADWYRPSKDGHMNDAARHIFYWLASNNLLSYSLIKALEGK